MTLGERGTLFVGTRKGEVYAVLPDKTAEGARKVVTIARKLNSPNGVAFHAGALYVAEIHRVLRYDGIELRLLSPPEAGRRERKLPQGRASRVEVHRLRPRRHALRPRGGAVQHLRTPDPRYAAILRMRLDGKGLEVFASGVRNTVGFDWHPETGELWFTDNGRDRMGDDVPPDELNRAPGKGLHFGFPYSMGGTFPTRNSAGKERRPPSRRPEMELPAHSACLGMRFYTGKMFPARYRGQIFIAQHGSWDRSEPVGYGVTACPAGRKPRRGLGSVRGRVAAERGGLGPPGGRAGDAGRVPPGVRRQGREDLPDLLRGRDRGRAVPCRRAIGERTWGRRRPGPRMCSTRIPRVARASAMRER